MKKLIALIIAIITLIGMNTANTAKSAETPIMEPTSVVIHQQNINIFTVKAIFSLKKFC